MLAAWAFAGPAGAQPPASPPGCTTADDGGPGRYRVATGASDGYYVKVGEALAAVDSRLDASSPGPTDANLPALRSGDAEFAIVQSDVAHDAWLRHPPFAGDDPPRPVALVAPLFVEAVHIVVRPHLNVARLTDFKGRRVWLGQTGSLTHFTATRILDAAGLTHADIDALETPEVGGTPIKDLDASVAVDALGSFDLDAVFQVGAVPYDRVRDALVPRVPEQAGAGRRPRSRRATCEEVRAERAQNSGLSDRELRLFGLDVDLVERLVRDGSYIEQLISPDEYCQNSSTLTVGVRALLLTSLPGDCEVPAQVARTIIDRRDAVEARLAKIIRDEQVAHGDPQTGRPSALSLVHAATPAPLSKHYHPSIGKARLYFDPMRQFIVRDVPLLAGCVLLIGIAIASRRQTIGAIVLSRPEWLLGAVALAAVWGICAAAMVALEGHMNDRFVTWSAAMVSLAQAPFSDRVQPATRDAQALLSAARWIVAAIFTTMLMPTLKGASSKAVAAIKERFELDHGVWRFSRGTEELELRRLPGLRLRIDGLSPARVVRTFPSAAALANFQTQLQEGLAGQGWRLETFAPERRSRSDRRHASADRRRLAS